MYDHNIIILQSILLNMILQDHGVNFRLGDEDRLFRGSIGPFSDDNLGAHAIGGFIESFSSLRICRICMGTGNDIQSKVSVI